MVYDEAISWPQGANGNGFTLELIDEVGNLCDGTNWEDGCPEGSPGTEFVTPCSINSVDDSDFGTDGAIIFPNPSSGVFHIRLPNSSNPKSEVMAEVYNYLGEKIYSITFTSMSNGMTLDLSGSPKGVYVIRIWIDNQFQDKIVVIS
jgi:hypothetical protein